MRYTVDELERKAGPYDPDAPPPLVMVEVLGPESHGRQVKRGPGDQVRAAFFGAKIGRQALQVTDQDPSIESKIDPRRLALRELIDELDADLYLHNADGELFDSPDDEAAVLIESRFVRLLAYAAYAVELETRTDDGLDA
jgi:hypothetical protein